MQSLTNELRNDTFSATKHINFSTHKLRDGAKQQKIETPHKKRKPTLKVKSELKREKLLSPVRKLSMETDPKKIKKVMKMLKDLAL